VRFLLGLCIAASSGAGPAGFIDATSTSKIGFVFAASKMSSPYKRVFVAREMAQ